MSAHQSRRVAVIGAGTMGHGIAEVFALGGHSVCIRDVEQRFLDNARDKMQSSVTKLHEKGRLAEDVQAVMGRVTFELDLGLAVKDKDIVVEAAPENLELKKEIFSELERLTSMSAILATNTSSLPITEIASAVSDPSRVVGMHFFNPPVLMKLVEVIKGDNTSPNTLQDAFKLMQSLGKRPILVQKDVPGFVVNRILARMMVTSRILVQEGMASVQEVDASLKYDAGLPMGAFELLDYIGLDTHEYVEEAMAQRGFAIPPGDLILSKVRTGHFGVKTGSGFYTYTKEQPRAVVPRELAGNVPPSLILSPAVNEAVFLMSSSVATRDDIDLSNVLGLSFPKGVLTFADEWGLDKVVENLETLKAKTQEKWLEPEEPLRQMVAKGLLGVKTGEGFYKHNRA